MAQAIATTAYRKAAAIDGSENSILKCQIPALEKMLWGGTLMLIVDHVINGELMLSFPFFTALAQEGGSMVFLRELLMVGLPMSLALTAAWFIYALLKARTLKASAR